MVALRLEDSWAYGTPSGVFAIKDGKLKVLDGDGSVHSCSDIEAHFFARRVVKLMDSGDSVLSDNKTGDIL